jgi:SH3 domain-containing YSC84-like protein 1
MRPIWLFLIVGISISSILLPSPSQAQIKEAAMVDESAGVLDEIMTTPEKGIPAWLLSDARGIAIVPNVVKGGLGIGVRFGRGVLLVRNEDGQWGPPTFITLTGGSLGWQVGIQATDVILVFKTHTSVQKLLSGKLTLGADAAVTAGPIGRQAAAGADVTLQSAVYSYSRSRGLFLGLALDGTALLIDHKANSAYYGRTVRLASMPKLQKSESVPPSATRLIEHLAKYTTAEKTETTTTK